MNVFFYLCCWHTVEVSRDSRHENGFEFPARGSYLLVRFCHACGVLLLVSCLLRMCKCRQWAEVRGGQQLFASPDSKTDNLVKTSKCVCWEGATRRIVKRSYGSGWSTLCVFRHHLLKTLLFFHCSSRDVPHLRQTVRDEYSIALPSECVQ